MFEVSFFEMVVIAVVALIVIGPERLPQVARTAGGWIGRIQRFFRSVKADVEQELSLQEYYQLHNKVLQEAQAVGQSVEGEARRLEQAMLEGLRNEKQGEVAPADQVTNGSRQSSQIQGGI